MNKILEIFGMIFTLLVIFTLEKEDKKKELMRTNEDNRKTLEVYCENINSIYYAWLKGTQEFIGQSESPRELAALLMTKYPTKTYNVIIEEKVA